MAKAKTKTAKVDPYTRLKKSLPPEEPPEPKVEPKPEPPKRNPDDDLVKNLLRSNKEIGNVDVKDGADPLHVRALHLFTKLMAGGMINPFAPTANQEVDRIIKDLTEAVKK